MAERPHHAGASSNRREDDRTDGTLFRLTDSIAPEDDAMESDSTTDLCDSPEQAGPPRLSVVHPSDDDSAVDQSDLVELEPVEDPIQTSRDDSDPLDDLRVATLSLQGWLEADESSEAVGNGVPTKPCGTTNDEPAVDPADERLAAAPAVGIEPHDDHSATDDIVLADPHHDPSAVSESPAKRRPMPPLPRPGEIARLTGTAAAPARIGSGRLVPVKLTWKPRDPLAGETQPAAAKSRFRWEVMLTAACGTAACGMGGLWLLRIVLS